MSSADTSYYRDRAATERELALSSDRQNVREIHEELARQYEALVEQESLRPGGRADAFAHDKWEAA